MRLRRGGVAHVAGVIEGDLADRGTGLRKTQIEGLADCAASALATRSANTAEWQTVLPRQTGDAKSKERYISRLLSNSLIEPAAVMEGFIPDIAMLLSAQDQTLILMMDQSKISDGFECLMVSLRLHARAIPVAWTVKDTKGGIGFDVQKPLLERVKAMLPAGIAVLLAADRFYGTAALVAWCQRQGWGYRIRLKGNLTLIHEGGELTTGEAVHLMPQGLTNADLYGSGVVTNIGVIHDPGHKEPWIIAMNAKPGRHTTLDYEMRWGIESMFSDFKSRGFSISKTHLHHADRIERLILVLTIAFYWAVSTGMQPKPTRAWTKKRIPEPDLPLQSRPALPSQRCSHLR